MSSSDSDHRRFLEPLEVEALAHTLAEQGEPHVLATVVWVRPPSSARTGQKAVLGPNGFVAGWVGGSCAQPIVVREALNVLRDGASRLVTIGRDGEFADVGYGHVADRMTCGSQGSMQVFLEARMPRTRLVVVGDAPAAEALLTMGRSIGYETVSVHRDGEGSANADHRTSSLDPLEWPVDRHTYVVVATRNQYDRDAVKAALDASAPYVAVVCSRKRADGLRSHLKKAEYGPEQLAALHAPAGLDFGSLAEREIAVAILAQIVELKSRASRPEVAMDATEDSVTADAD
ncbi:MAG: XdhC family protein [Myxococcota bacterium]